VKLDTRRLQQLLFRIPQQTDRAVGKIAEDAVRTMALHMDEPKTGLVRDSHQASAPGEAPAVDTGYLKNSLRAKRVQQGTWLVYAGAEYAPHLEFGTIDMAPRPYFVRSIEEASRGLLRELEAIFK